MALSRLSLFMSNIDYQFILNKIGYKLTNDGSFWRTKPLYRQSDNSTSLRICKKTGRWSDFSINTGGSFRKLVELTCGNLQIEMIDFDDEIQRLDTPRIEFKKEKKLEEILLLNNHNFYLKRGISIETLKTFGGGMATKGKLFNRYVFPIFDIDKNIIGYAGRDLMGNSDIKWKLLGRKNKWVYPSFLSCKDIENGRSVILVESIGDALALFENGIKNVLVLFGVSLSSAIICFLIKLKVKKVYISLNNEPNNNNIGNQAASKIEFKIRNLFQEVVIKLPTKKDFGEMDKNEIEQWKKTI